MDVRQRAGYSGAISDEYAGSLSARTPSGQSPYRLLSAGAKPQLLNAHCFI